MDGYWNRARFSRLLCVLIFAGGCTSERVTLLELPDKGIKTWSWEWTEYSNKDAWLAYTYLNDSVTMIEQIACDSNPTGQPNAWLRSDEISVEHAQRLEVTATYTARNCTTIGNPRHCKTKFDIYLHESRGKLKDLPNPYLRPESFKKVGTLQAKILINSIHDLGKNTDTQALVLSNETKFVYFALHYTGGCIGVQSFLAEYFRCPKMALPTNLVEIRETVAPAKDSLKVKGSCVAHSQPLTDVTGLYGYCRSDGEWSTVMYRGKCLCDAGYQDTGSACTKCPSGTYKTAAGNSSCVACPANSEQEIDGLNCRCIKGYYRASNEGITTDCTAPPSAPRDVNATYINATLVYMRWFAPASTGGRSDISYKVECKSCNHNGSVCKDDCNPKVFMQAVNLNVTRATVIHLSAYTHYRFKVYAMNGVSQKAEKNGGKPNYGELVLKTKDAVPGAPEIIAFKRSKPRNSEIFLSWTANKKNALITYYQVSYYPVNEPSKIRTFNTTLTNATINKLEQGKEYRFEVRAASRLGIGALAKKNVILNKEVPGVPFITELRRSKSTNSIFIKWTLHKSNGLITYYQVSYFPINEPSKRRTFNTTLMNATINELEEGKVYYFEVRAGSRLGLGPVSQKKSIFITKEVLFTWEVIAGIAGAAGVFFIFMVIVIMLCIHHKSRREKQKRLPESQHILEMGHDVLPTKGQRMYIDPSNYGDPMDCLKCIASEIDRERIKLDRLIGGGEFAEVYEGHLKNESEGEKVAVKILKAGSERKTRDDFVTEASIMGQFKHPNVIALKGVVTLSRPMMIVTEFMENGSLDHYLKEHDGKLTVLQLIGMARGVAAGMDYLSGINFIHRDLAARNILVSDNMTTKVADFGLSRELDDLSENPDSEYQTQGGKIPVRWTSPEAIKYRKFSSASDVWSYGILLWEIMSFAERPYWGWDNFQVMERVEGGYRLPAPMNCPKIIHNLMMDCWRKEKCSRPKFMEIVSNLEELIRSPEKLQDEFVHTYSFSRNDNINFDEVESIEEWLESINMGRYLDAFHNHGCTVLEHVQHLKEEDLTRLGIKLIGHRNKIYKSIKAMIKHFEAMETSVDLAL